MDKAMNERPIPSAALQDDNSVEMARIWIANNGLHCSLKVGMYHEQGEVEEEAWGIILSDVARLISQALEQYGKSPNKSLDIIAERFNLETTHPTSDISGELD
jgi:hypothetical protein